MHTYMHACMHVRMYALKDPSGLRRALNGVTHRRLALMYQLLYPYP